ncbi:unnamed protein product [Cochlearia groenlandica]
MKRSRFQEKKTSQSPKRQQHEHSNGIHIPLDLTVNILSKLPVKSLVRFQCVSNLWSSLIVDTMIITTTTRSNLTIRPPRCLPLFILPHWLLNSSTFSSYTNYPQITNHATFISAAKERFALANGLISSDDFEYEYIRGLLCSREFDDDPEIIKRISNKPSSSSSCGDGFLGYDRDGFFGYDIVENQSFKLMGIPILKQKHWRNLDNIGVHSQTTTSGSSGLCINGVIYYIDFGLKEIVWWDLRLERFGRIGMSVIISSNSKLEELTLVNYQGKLGCVHYCRSRRSNSDSVSKMWVMENHQQKEEEYNWSKSVIMFLPQVESESNYSHCVAGATPNGDIVLMPKTLKSCQKFFNVCYYHPKQHNTRIIGKVIC